MAVTNTVDFHCHSRFSPDARDSMADMCARAVEIGLTAVAFTEHAEWHPRWQTLPDLPAYFAEIDRCRDHFASRGLAVYSGIELGNPHEYQSQVAGLLDGNTFDIVIASMHWLYGESIQMEACFRDRDADDVYADYFIALGDMAASVDAHIVAHFDRILWRGALLGSPLRPQRLENIIRDSLATVASRGMALELNTRYLASEPAWRDAVAQMLSWYAEEGGQMIVVNSDAHSTGQLGANLDVAYELLRRVGLEPIASREELVLSKQKEMWI